MTEQDANLSGDEQDALINMFDDIAETGDAAREHAERGETRKKNLVRMIAFLDHKSDRLLNMLGHEDNEVEDYLFNLLMDNPMVYRVEVARVLHYLEGGQTEEEISWALEDAGVDREERFAIIDAMNEAFDLPEFDPEEYEAKYEE